MDSVAHLGIPVAEEHSNAPERIGDVSLMEVTCPEINEMPVITEGAAEVSIIFALKGDCTRTVGGPAGARDSCANNMQPTVSQRSCCEFRGYRVAFK